MELHGAHLQEPIRTDDLKEAQQTDNDDLLGDMLLVNIDEVQDSHDTLGLIQEVKVLVNTVEMQGPSSDNWQDGAALVNTEEGKGPHGDNLPEDFILISKKRLLESFINNLRDSPSSNLKNDEFLTSTVNIQENEPCITNFPENLMDNTENVHDNNNHSQMRDTELLNILKNESQHLYPQELLLNTEISAQKSYQSNLEDDLLFGNTDLFTTSTNAVSENKALLDDSLTSEEFFECFDKPTYMSPNPYQDRTVKKTDSSHPEPMRFYNFPDQAADFHDDSLSSVNTTNSLETSDNTHESPLLSVLQEPLKCETGFVVQKAHENAYDSINKNKTNGSLSNNEAEEPFKDQMSFIDNLLDNDAIVSESSSSIGNLTSIDTSNIEAFVGINMGDDLTISTMETVNHPKSTTKSMDGGNSRRKQPTRREYQGLGGLWSPTDPLCIRSRCDSLRTEEKDLSQVDVCYAQGPPIWTSLATDKPDYGLEELSSANVKQKFSMFENKAKEKDTRSLEPAHVRRSQSLMNKAARFLKGDEEDSEGEYGVENSRLGEFDEDDDEDEEEEEEEEEESEYEEIEVTDEEAEEEEEIKVNGTKENGQHEEDNEDEEKDDEEKDDEEKDDEEKDEEENEDKDEVKENGIDEEDSKPKKKIKKIIKVKKEKPKKEKKEKRSRRERPGKNTNLKEMFESGKIDNCDSDDERTSRKEQIKIERTHNASRSIKDRFEKGEAYGGADSDEDRNGTDERRECEEIFREAETARAARKRFNQIDSKVKGEGRDIMRSQSFANAPITNRRISQDGLEPEAVDFGRDPNLIKSTDKFDDNIDCARTKTLLNMFKKMEMQGSDDDEQGPPPPRRFTPPPEGEEYDSEEYSDEEYTDDDEDDYTDDEEDDEEEDENGVKVPKYKDEVLEMKATQDKSPKQSARKAANLRAKFEKWENGKNDVNKGSDEEGEEAMPSIDTARNLRKMFENKATEQPVPVNKPKHKVNRFVGGGGEKCVKCSKTVYALERLEVVGKVLHKRCFKCAKCKSTLGMGNFSVGGENYYCTTHYKQMFAEKGTYDVFTPDKGKWTRKIEASNGEAPKSQE